MKIAIAILTITAVIGIAMFPSSGVARRAIIKPMDHGKRAPILVELFTSEGCSDCPPADKLLEKLVREQPIDGADVIVLSEHVDYWNYLGWKDPYSQAQFSQRQAGYVKSMGLHGAYTPQMVVDGQAEFVGSDQLQAANSISEASGRHKASIQLSVANVGTAVSTLKVSAANIPLDSGVWLAVTEDDLHSSVSRGENSGRSLEHTGVVRELLQIGTATHGHDFSKEVPVEIHATWNRKKLKFVVFLQAPGQGRVVGAAVTAFN